MNKYNGLSCSRIRTAAETLIRVAPGAAAGPIYSTPGGHIGLLAVALPEFKRHERGGP